MRPGGINDAGHQRRLWPPGVRTQTVSLSPVSFAFHEQRPSLYWLRTDLFVPSSIDSCSTGTQACSSAAFAQCTYVGKSHVSVPSDLDRPDSALGLCLQDDALRLVTRLHTRRQQRVASAAQRPLARAVLTLRVRLWLDFHLLGDCAVDMSS